VVVIEGMGQKKWEGHNQGGKKRGGRGTDKIRVGAAGECPPPRQTGEKQQHGTTETEEGRRVTFFRSKKKKACLLKTATGRGNDQAQEKSCQEKSVGSGKTKGNALKRLKANV